MLSKDEGFTVDDLEKIYAAGWEVGACNLIALINDLPATAGKARREIGGNQDEWRKHPALIVLMGQINYLAGIGLGPEAEDAAKLQEMIKSRLQTKIAG